MVQSIVLFCTLFFLLCSAASAQKEANIWYFGGLAGIDFNGENPRALSNSAMSTPEGCASIADVQGNLLFYTNGRTIWNRFHVAMVNGTDLLGHESATQSAVIVPQPGSSTLYYVFTNTTPATNSGLRYSIVDMSLSKGFGEVTTKNIPVRNSISEKLVAIRHQNQQDVWIVVHGWNSSSFYSFRLTSKGFDPTPVVSTSGSRHEGTDNFINAIGEMKASPNGSKLAVAIFERGFEVFDFSTVTGQVSNPIPLFLPNFTGCYGIAFSPDGTKMYGTVRASSQVYQFDLNQSASGVAASATPIRETGTESPAGSLQLAPDGKIYHTRDNDNYLGLITSPNQTGKAAGYVEKGLYLEGNRSRMGLPNFMSNYLSPAFSYTNSCLGDTTRFVISEIGDVDLVHWDFGDSKDNYSTSFTPSHIYTSSGSYTVTLIKLQGGDTVERVEREVRVLALPPTGLTKKMVLCETDLTLNVENPLYTDYTWSTGEKLPAIRITQPGVYWVEVFNQNCSRIDTVEVFRSVFELATGSDVTLCEGDSIPLFASGAVAYEWQPTIGLDSPTSPTPMAFPTGTTTYTVRGTGDDGCVQEKYVTVTVVPLPIVNLGPDTVLCTGQSYTLDAGGGAGFYLWSTGEKSQTISVNTTGTYRVQIFNGSCTRSDSVTVSFVPTDVTVSANALICEGESVMLSATGMTSYMWSPQTGIDNPFSATPIVCPAVTTIYTVTGTNETGCTGKAEITVEVAPAIPIHLGLPDITVQAGAKNVRIPLTIQTDYLPIALPACTISIRFDATSFLPTGCSLGIMSERTTGQETFVTIQMPATTITEQRQIFTELIGTALLGRTAQTEIVLGSVVSDGCLRTEQRSGLLSLKGCAIDSRAITFGSTTGLTVTPNPLSEEGKVTIATIEDGNYTLAVYTMHGQKVWQDTFAVHTADSIDRQLPTNLFVTGLYQLVLTTPSALRSTLFFIAH